MNYFDYLSLTKQEDTRDTFEKYLMAVLDYTEEQAKNESKIFYEEENENGSTNN